ncbi:hypothetical protein WN51_03614 [Melipona quadrifasciata]|uniref:Uncharacterized protein n=1 Tax=Melipona quadrifasciata TaxID=166423 RepID=A0A0M8ZWJ7_9HYME|nr:hypothetical protein WN51_03614 [Melipona quadrifasciata]
MIQIVSKFSTLINLVFQCVAVFCSEKNIHYRHTYVTQREDLSDSLTAKLREKCKKLVGKLARGKEGIRKELLRSVSRWGREQMRGRAVKELNTLARSGRHAMNNASGVSFGLQPRDAFGALAALSTKDLARKTAVEGEPNQLLLVAETARPCAPSLKNLRTSLATFV